MDEIPYGYCHCNCGQKTRIPTRNDAKAGQHRGVPLKYIHGHQHSFDPFKHYDEIDCGYVSPCWIWKGGLKNGYAVLQGKRVHQLFYEKYVGRIPVGLELNHLCEIKACVNPAHLNPSTHTENVRYSALLDRQKVETIRNLFDSGTLKPIALSKKFGVTVQQIWNIVKRRQWV